nr:MAG TPA: hypothetical protein [Caudoviricetes sp.]
MGGRGQGSSLVARQGAPRSKSKVSRVNAKSSSQRRAITNKRRTEMNEMKIRARNANTRGRIQALKAKDVKASGVSFNIDSRTASIKRVYQGKKSSFSVTMGDKTQAGLSFTDAKKTLNDMLGIKR